ncbi:MAG: polymerase subunit delta [Thermoleophilaceae bacterium]|jgi:DNA polymerase-3 subunit delta|nr:polymerase subunit delta [Thermoleophilaceae bacterium]
MAGLKPAYLISGDDDAKIDAWRARVRRRAEDENGPGALETFTAPADPPEAVATALTTLTFATGDRYLLADNVETWKAGDLDPLERELAAIPEGTVLVLIARGKPPAQRLVKAIEKAGGEHREYAAPKPWQMPKWAIERARDEGLNLDQEAAKALVSAVGPRQQRLAREIERLAILAHPRAQLTADEITRLATGDATEQVYDLADALVGGDVPASLSLAEQLTSGGDDRPSKLVYPIVRRLRDVHRAAELLDAGVPEAKVASAMKMPPWAAKRAVAQAKKADREALARALCAFADLEIELRGGGAAGLDEDTAFSLTLARAAAA